MLSFDSLVWNVARPAIYVFAAIGLFIFFAL